jgi:hypothetical protein
MNGSDTARLHAHDLYAREAIRECVHNAACRHGHDHMHPRIEVEMCRVSWEVTRRAQDRRDPRKAS